MIITEMSTSERLEDYEIRAEYGSEAFKYDVADVLIAARKMKNLTQAALAKIAGVSQAYIAKLESGDANPTISRIGAILASIWFKPQITLVPLIHRGESFSASSSLSIPRGGKIIQSTANDALYPGIDYTSPFGALNIPTDFLQMEQKGMINAAV